MGLQYLFPEAHDFGSITRGLSTDELSAAVHPRFRGVFESGLANYGDSSIRATQVVAIILTRYLVDSGSYDVVAIDVDRDGRYKHVYGFRKGWPHTRAVLEMIEATGRYQPYRSYLAVRRHVTQLKQYDQP